MAHSRQSRPDSGLGFQVQVLRTFRVFPLLQTNEQEEGGNLRGSLASLEHLETGKRQNHDQRRGRGPVCFHLIRGLKFLYTYQHVHKCINICKFMYIYIHIYIYIYIHTYQSTCIKTSENISRYQYIYIQINI